MSVFLISTVPTFVTYVVESRFLETRREDLRQGTGTGVSRVPPSTNVQGFEDSSKRPENPRVQGKPSGRRRRKGTHLLVPHLGLELGRLLDLPPCLLVPLVQAQGRNEGPDRRDEMGRAEEDWRHVCGSKSPGRTHPRLSQTFRGGSGSNRVRDMCFGSAVLSYGSDHLVDNV